jgi:hypothetical protein
MDMSTWLRDDPGMPDMTLVVVAAVAFLLALVFWWKEHSAQRAHERWCSTAAHADGVVSRIADLLNTSRNPPRSGSGLRTLKAPVVRFRAHDGVEYEFDAIGAHLNEGAAVRVAYPSELPSDARLVDRPGKYGCAALLLVAAVAATIAAFWS